MILALRSSIDLTADDHALNTDPGLISLPSAVANDGAPRRAGGAIGRLEPLPQQSELLKKIRVDAGALHASEHDRRVLADESELTESEACREEVGLLRSSLGLTAPLRRAGWACRCDGLFTGWWLNGPRV